MKLASEKNDSQAIAGCRILIDLMNSDRNYSSEAERVLLSKIEELKEIHGRSQIANVLLGSFLSKLESYYFYDKKIRSVEFSSNRPQELIFDGCVLENVSFSWPYSPDREKFGYTKIVLINCDIVGIFEGFGLLMKYNINSSNLDCDIQTNTDIELEHCVLNECSFSNIKQISFLKCSVVRGSKFFDQYFTKGGAPKDGFKKRFASIKIIDEAAS